MKAADEIKAATEKRGSLGKAADDEPVFILRAQDKLASYAVREWALRAEGFGVDADKVKEARECAEEMDLWRVRHGGGKLPD